VKNNEIATLRNAAIVFRKSPSPSGADNLLTLLAPHRENNTISLLIDEVLDYKFLVGTIPSQTEVATG
jgi:hypothetical protein